MWKNRLTLLLVGSLAFGLCSRTLHGQQADSLAKVFSEIQSSQIEVIDLTHPLDDQSPYWPEGSGPSPFHAKVVSTFEKGGYFARDLDFPEHFGTHMDAPAHFDPKGKTIDQIPVTEFLRAAIVIDVSEAAKSNVDYRVTAQDLKNWEKRNGAIPPGCVVFFRTGWAQRWPSQKEYMNQDAQGRLHFPGLSLEAAHYLLDRSHPVAIGIDTASIDYGPSQDFEVHHLTMPAGLYHLENVANLDRLPARGAYVVALPMNLKGGSGSPTRVLALLPRKEIRNSNLEIRK
ncbi:MAG TPA: cyclase family protein [Terriglobia bacterium]|nr:cyclase family protein [Terriglobia bacterium]